MKMVSKQDNIIYAGRVRPKGEPFELKNDQDVNFLKEVGCEIFSGKMPVKEEQAEPEQAEPEQADSRFSVRKSVSVPTLNDLNHMTRDRLKALASNEGLEINPKWNNKNLASQIHKRLVQKAAR
jgi:hypothetical protein